MDRDDVAWELIAPYGVTPGKASMVRRAVYTFHSRLAEQWRDGRTFLVGDAAHVMPPFMGQGMCSGMRDATNLAWRLDLVLRGATDESVLASYQVERSPHVETVIHLSTEAGRVSCTFDPEIAAARDDAFRRGDVPPPPPFPHLLQGLLSSSATDAAAELVGHLSPQGRVRLDGLIGRFDDLVGSGWRLVLAPGATVPADLSVPPGLVEVGVRIVVLAPAGSGDEGVPVDVDDYYASYFADRGVQAVLYRPDFYVYGAAVTALEVPALLDELADALMVPGAELIATKNSITINHDYLLT